MSRNGRTNTLTAAKVVQVAKWLDIHKDALPQHNMDHWMAKAAKEIPFHITENNLYGLIRQLKLPSPKRRTQGQNPNAGQRNPYINKALLSDLLDFVEFVSSEMRLKLGETLQAAVDANNAALEAGEEVQG